MGTQTERELRPDLPDEVLSVVRATRRIGYGLLVGAIIVDVSAEQFAAVRKFFGARLTYFADEVLPNPQPLLEFALAILGASEITR